MKALTALALVLAMLSPTNAADCRCGSVWCAQNGIMTHLGKYAVVQVNPYNRSMACWCDYDTYAEARKALASQPKR